jgi:uncharacterized protein YkwD
MKIKRASIFFCACFLVVTIFTGSGSNLDGLAATRQQIFPQSTNVIQSRLLGAAGVAAYIVSSQGTNRGLLIHAVSQNGLAARIGLAPGDVLLNLNSRVVDSASQADRILSGTASGALRCVFVRQGGNGLQLYNLSTAYTNVAPPATSIASSSSASPSSSQSRPKKSEDTVTALPQIETYVAELVNADRKKFGLSPLTVHSAIGEVARTFAQDMARRGFKSHIDPEGRDPTARGAAAGLTIQLGENFGWSSGMSYSDGCNKINNDMMAEPPDDPHNHRGNILNTKYGQIGCGAAVNSKTGELIIVEDFAI